MKNQPNLFLKHLDLKIECSVKLQVVVPAWFYIEISEFFMLTSDFQLVILCLE